MFYFVLFYLIKTAAKVMGEWTRGLLRGSRWVEEGAAPGLLCPGLLCSWLWAAGGTAKERHMDGCGGVTDGKDGQEAGALFCFLSFSFNFRNILERTQNLYCNNCNAKL